MAAKRLAAAAALVMVLAPGRAAAHHAFSAEFDASKPVMLRGTVTKIELINPHCWIHIAVTGLDGQVVNWMIEGGSPNALIRQGITKNSLPIGTVLLVDGYQAKDGANRAVGKDVTLADGRRLFLGGSALPSAADSSVPR
jgi:hypothetical protein